jgi:hypothetical protein
MMRSRIYLGAAAVAVAAFGGLLEPSPDRSLGVRSAQAKDYYTRKRVNGRWITGRFPKNSAGVKRPPKPEVLRFSAAPQPDSPPRSAETPVPARQASEAFSPAAGPEPLAPPPGNGPLLRLRAALESYARTLATGILPVPATDEGATAPVQPKPTAVSFDLQTGVKRTTFSDGSVLEEEFDIEAMRNQVAAQGNEPRGPETRRAP